MDARAPQRRNESLRDVARAVADVAGSGSSARSSARDNGRSNAPSRDASAERFAPSGRSARSDGGRRPERDASTSRETSSRGGRGSRSGNASVEASSYVQPHLRGGPRQGSRPNVANGRGGRVKQYIDPAKFVRKAMAVVQEEYVPQHRFQDFPVTPRIIANLLAKGYEEPTPIQDQTISLVLAGKDVVGIANTGTGKTAAFAVPLIHDLVTHMDNRLLVMAPTRELAQQIVEETLSFSKGCGLKIACLIGGASMNLQTKALAQNPRIVVGTPGRIKDHIGQGTLNLARFNRVVLDEVDRMLDMGFIKDITAILSKVNPSRQSLFFSATMEDETEALIRRFSKNPETVSVKTGVTADGVNQSVVWYRSKEDKIEKLHDLLINGDVGKAIIFDDTKRLVERLGKELALRGFSVDRIHGDKSQAQRTRAIARLKSGEIKILVATDVAARGIDVSDVTHVINYSQPNTYEDYVHRIGRTGRAGKTGEAITFLESPS